MKIRRIIETPLGQIQTTKLLSISSSETLYTLGTSNRAFEVTNLGDNDVYYGDSGVLVNSGGIISPDNSRTWDHVIGNFNLYLVVNSGGVTSNVVIHEYA